MALVASTLARVLQQPQELSKLNIGGKGFSLGGGSSANTAGSKNKGCCTIM